MEDKKFHIVKNVGLMYLKQGIRAVTMDDVATEFGISKKTLYQYFSDKENLVSQVVDYFLENPDFNLTEMNRGNAIDDIFKIRRHVAFIQKFYNNNIENELKKTYPSLFKKVHETKRQRIFESTVENLNLGISQGLYRKDLETSIVAKLQLGRLLYTSNPDYKIFEEYEVNSLAFFDSVTSYHMHAICNEKGIKYFEKQLKKIQNEDTN